jgi:hypothetical protein
MSQSRIVFEGHSAMISSIERKQGEVAALCQRYNVRRLELFGSAATDDFDSARSDLDFLVEFQPGQDLGPWLRHYFDLRDELARLFDRPVDLVMAEAVTDPRFRTELERTRVVLYAAAELTRR